MRLELHGMLTAEDLTRFMYFQRLRRVWPFAAVATIIADIVVLGLIAVLIAGYEMTFEVVPPLAAITFGNWFSGCCLIQVPESSLPPRATSTNP